MKHNKTRKILSAFLIVFGFVIFFHAATFLGAGGILNELDSALEGIHDLEKRNLLNTPPDNISENTKSYLDEFHSAANLKQHIRDYEKQLHYRDILFFIFLALFLVSLVLRIHFRKKIASPLKNNISGFN